jgi:hypothetical protein
LIDVIGSYVNASFAFANRLAGVNNDSKVFMKGDDTTWLAAGQYRDRSALSAWFQR